MYSDGLLRRWGHVSAYPTSPGFLGHLIRRLHLDAVLF